LFRYNLVVGILLGFAILNTILLGLQLVSITPWTPPVSSGNSTVITQRSPPPVALPLILLQSHSLLLAPISWGAVVGVWIWRGRIKSRWTRLGLDQGLFRLLLQMKGSATRTTILKSLLTPKDRLQLAKDLDLDWTTIDYHIQVLLKHGLIEENTAYGNVRLYELTKTGSDLLSVLEEINARRTD
jgi:DNA-binding transcriptional ArsR family regulator